MSKTLLLVAMSAILTEKSRTDGKVSRQYYTAEFQNPENPFGPSVKRVIWQQHNADGTQASWRAGNPTVVKGFLGKQIPGEIVCQEVPAYNINGTDGVTRQATKYTTVVFTHETIASVFKAAGHPLDAPAVSTATIVKEENPAIKELVS